MLPEKVPEYKRRALRLALGVFLPCYVGFGLLVLEESPLALSAQTACKWAAISATVVAQPIIGKASQVGFERILGTVLGGFIGFVVHTLGSTVFFSEYTDGTYLTISAAFFAGLSTVIGHKYKLETSARLFTITLLLITFAGDAGQTTYHVAIVRVTGILLGVVIMLVLSVLILPKSATIQCLHDLDSALEHLHYLHALTFHDILPSSIQEVDALSDKSYSKDPWDDIFSIFNRKHVTFHDHASSGAAGVNMLRGHDPHLATGNAARGSTIRGSTSNHHGENEETSVPLLVYDRLESNSIAFAAGRIGHGFLDPGAEHEEQCDAALTGVYSSLFDLQKNIDLARAEAVVGVWHGRVIVAPRMPLSRSISSAHLPWEGLDAVSLSIRKTARRLFSLGQALDAGEASALRRTIPESGALVEEVARAGHAALLSLRDAFPTQGGVSSKNILRYIRAVEMFDACGTQAMKDYLGRSRRYQLLKLAWEELISSVRRSENNNGGNNNTSRNSNSGSGGANNTSSTAQGSSCINEMEGGRDAKSSSEETSPTTGIEAVMMNHTTDDATFTDSSFLEWQSLAFLITDLGTDIVTLHYQLMDVMKKLPYHKEEYRFFV